jgi:hypothetical protein
MDFINASISGTEKVLSLFALIFSSKNFAFSLNSEIAIFKTSSPPEISIISSLIEYSKSPLFSVLKTRKIG